MSWVELSLNIKHEAVDWVCTLLAATRYTDDIYVTKYTNLDANFPITPDITQPQWAFTIRLYLASDVYIEEIANSLLSLQRAGLCSPLQEAFVEKKPQLEGINPIIHRIGQRFVVLTPETPYEPTADEIVLRLKTNLAFGSGLHPTTILNLRLLERHVVPKMNVLDLGSGSGILSVAMAKLGAYVLAVDNDSIAVQSTQDAVHRNGVEKHVTVMRGSLGRGSELGHWMGGTIDNVSAIEETQTFDLITANILARIHITLAPDFQRALRRDSTRSGLLIASGFDTDYEDAVTATFTEVGFEAIDKEQLDEWVAIAYHLKE
ncbi:methyltransferase [Scytonema sp. UIC 10036]|uniref:50S ribosomal protein L11 methyltransferase n=1 Tax=Scytonema sp. UIC 10036 TaxID=2304196 RepID=UPI0012DA8776|nr:50S ribosomal protein L11 methyltransferase [Scytonema sp. UIC 10036]MUG94854.1 methyltransferase [Scytonema sp. UIC 10036]